jgi:transposase
LAITPVGGERAAIAQIGAGFDHQPRHPGRRDQPHAVEAGNRQSLDPVCPHTGARAIGSPHDRSQLRALASEIDRLEAQILAWHRSDAASSPLATMPGIGPITTSAIAAAVPDATMFRSGRQFAAWLGLTPRPHSSGGKEKLGGISKQGDGYLRSRLVVGATAVMRMARKDPAKQPWAAQLLTRKPVKIATVTLANKTARVAWTVMARNEVYAAAAA